MANHNIPLFCKFSGLRLGEFVANVAVYGTDGTSPYIKNWKQETLLHPIFSLSTSALLHKAKSNAMLEKEGKKPWPMQQKQLAMLALLHSEDFLVQDLPCLPPPHVADTFIAEVIVLVDYKLSINSQRLHFPRLHIWKESGFEQIAPWLKVCNDCIADYESTVRVTQREAKQKAAALAMRSIRKNMYEDVSLRRLWSWVDAQMPNHLNSELNDAKDLFFAAEKNIQNWSLTEIDDLEALFLEHCETGNSISYEVSKRLAELKRWLNVYQDTFEIIIPEQDAALVGIPAPLAKDFTSKAAFYVAEAKWKLANKAASKTASNLAEEL